MRNSTRSRNAGSGSAMSRPQPEDRLSRAERLPRASSPRRRVSPPASGPARGRRRPSPRFSRSSSAGQRQTYAPSLLDHPAGPRVVGGDPVRLVVDRVRVGRRRARSPPGSGRRTPARRASPPSRSCRRRRAGAFRRTVPGSAGARRADDRDRCAAPRSGTGRSGAPRGRRSLPGGRGTPRRRSSRRRARRAATAQRRRADPRAPPEAVARPRPRSARRAIGRSTACGRSAASVASSRAITAEACGAPSWSTAFSRTARWARSSTAGGNDTSIRAGPGLKRFAGRGRPVGPFHRATMGGSPHRPPP